MINNYQCTEETGPKFWLVWDMPGTSIDNRQYSYITPVSELTTGREFLEVFDTEEELASRVDELKEQPGWYWLPENRIPNPPNPNLWEE